MQWPRRCLHAPAFYMAPSVSHAHICMHMDALSSHVYIGSTRAWHMHFTHASVCSFVRACARSRICARVRALSPLFRARLVVVSWKRTPTAGHCAHKTSASSNRALSACAALRSFEITSAMSWRSSPTERRILSAWIRSDNARPKASRVEMMLNHVWHHLCTCWRWYPILAARAGAVSPQNQIPMAILYSVEWGHLTRFCQFDDGTRQQAQTTYQDALKKHSCLNMEDLQYEAEILTQDQASQNILLFAIHLTCRKPSPCRTWFSNCSLPHSTPTLTGLPSLYPRK